MRYLITTILFTLVFVSCQDEKYELPALDPETILKIKSLETVEEKNKFLFGLWQEDQNLRRGEGHKIAAKYGNESDEYKAYIKKLIHLDNLVFAKIKFYLETHGYPRYAGRYDELALNAFPTIIGHHHYYKSQAELLPYLYDAYKSNQCALGDVVWLLGEMHESKHRGRRYEMKSNQFTTEQEFKELVDALGLDLEL